MASHARTNVAKPARNRIAVPVKTNSTWNISSNPQSQNQGTYASLKDSHELVPVETKGASASVASIDTNKLKRSNGIKVTQTMELESLDASIEDMDLEAQKGV